MSSDAARRWIEGQGTWFANVCSHDPGRAGRLDETARRLDHPEHAVAQLLVGEGHDVRSLREARGRGRTPDLLVCGRGVEVKSWDPLELRGGRPPAARSVVNKLLDGGGQAAAVVLFGQGSGITPATVRRGLTLYAGHKHGSRVTSARVLGDGFDLSWSRLHTAGHVRAPILGL